MSARRSSRFSSLALALLLPFAALTGPARADPDVEQQKSWLFLQKLAQEVEELDACASATRDRYEDWTPYDRARRHKVELFINEIDAYIQRYAATRRKGESSQEFRFRVWAVTLDAGRRTARPTRQLTPIDCRALLQ